MTELPPVGPYQIDKVIGSGGFATVFRAWDERLGGQVAVKVLADNHSLDAGIRTRFVSEGHVLRRVDSPYVITVFDVGETDRGQPFLVLEHADRGDLETRMTKLRADGYSPDRGAVLALASVLGRALEAVHAEDVVHRDLTPRNVLLKSTSASNRRHATPVICGDERALVADLGLAKDLAASSGLTVAGGTSGFAAPEQAAGGMIDDRADIYAASALIVWFIGGAPPTSDGNWTRAVKEMEPALVGVLQKGLAADRLDRHESARVWLQEIEAALVEPSPRRHDAMPRALIGGVALVVVALGWFALRSPGHSVTVLNDGRTRIEAVTDTGRVVLIGPGLVTVGDTARFVTDQNGLAAWTWIGPDGRVHSNVAGIDVVTRSAGLALVRLVATTVDGDTVELTHELVVEP